MKDFGHWIDAHGHLADGRWLGHDENSSVSDVLHLDPHHKLALVLQEAKKLGIGFFMQGGVSPSDWQLQQKLKEKYPHEIGLCFGLHPYWVAAQTEENCEIAMDMLAPLLVEADAIGELGLDFRPHILKDSRERQFTFFENQLELAEATHKPMVLHIVQAHAETIQILDVWGVPPALGFVHSFNSSMHKGEEYIRRGLMLSIGGPVCRLDNIRLRQAVKDIPLEFLLLETDSPDQPPPKYQNQLNPPASLWEVAKTVGELKSLDPGEILDISSANFRRLFKWN